CLFFTSLPLTHTVKLNADIIAVTPADIYTKGEDAKINCSHSITNYDRILWYKQSKNQLQLLGYMYIESGVNVAMDGSAEQNKMCTLTIRELNLNSSGVYFCAASNHSAAYHCTSIQKPPNHIFFYTSILFLFFSILEAILNNSDHLLYNIFMGKKMTSTGRLFFLCCKMERFRKSSVPTPHSHQTF
uniref:Ig-like domain-containing protein n=1 Tax=Amphilophus citrinellus TaxID=61819 RepID=A0A3Q0RTV3_AMPCI